MKKRITLFCRLSLLFFVALLPLKVEAQQAVKEARIIGSVLDAKTQETLPYVQVTLVETTVGTTTDLSGKFSLDNLPAGTFTLEARYMGFSVSRKKVHLSSAQTRVVRFLLEEQSIDLDGVVVSANRQVTRRKLAPSLVTVLSGRDLIKTNSENLSQGLRFQPGLRVEDNCQNCGFNQVRINGLEGAYSQILIDSRPVFSALAGVYGLEQIPASMIERVEVIRGGGSALFGANAVGGVINVITREPLRNSASVTQNATTFANDRDEFSSFNPTTSFNASLVTDDRKAAMMIFGQYSARDGFDFNGDDYTETPELKNRALGFRTYYKTGIYSKISAEFRSMHEHRRGGDNLELPPFRANIAEYLQHYITGGSIRFDQGYADGKNKFSLYASGQKVLRKSYYGGGGEDLDELFKDLDETKTALTSYGTSKGFDAQVGGMYIHKFPKNFHYTGGLEATFSTLTDLSGYRPAEIDQKVNTYSQFNQIEYKSDKWSFLLGGRFDYVTLFQNGEKDIDPVFVFSPRANVRYNPVKDFSMRLSYSEGFRAPQYFDEDMHVALAGGEPISRVLSKDLKEERSRSVSLSLDYYGSFSDDWQYNVMAEGFLTTLTNQFVESPIQKTINGIQQRYIINDDGGKAKVYGSNLEAKIAFRRFWELQFGLTLQKSQYANEVEHIAKEDALGGKAIKTKDYIRTPEVYGYFTSTLRPLKKLSFIFSGTYTGSMLVPHEAYTGGVPTGAVVKNNEIDFTDKNGARYLGLEKGVLVDAKPFFDFDFKANYQFQLSKAVKMDLSVGMQNIFNAYQKDSDMGAGRASTFVYGPMLPRRFYTSITFNI